MKLIKNQWEVRPLNTKGTDRIITEDFVEKYHYHNGMGKVCTNIFGLYYKADPNTLHGVSVWNVPAYGAAKSVSNIPNQVLGLTRFCLVDDRPENAGSFLISKSIKSLDKKYGMLLTYADNAQNHDGGLYRASNWNYNGLTNELACWIDPVTGRGVSKKSGKNNYNNADMVAMGYKYIGKYSKHKFTYNNSNRKNLIVNSRNTDNLIFTKDGKVVPPGLCPSCNDQTFITSLQCCLNTKCDLHINKP